MIAIVLASTFGTVAAFEAGIIVMLLRLGHATDALKATEAYQPAEPEPDPEPSQALEDMVKLEVDPNDPPRYTAYNPVLGHDPMLCHCHGRVLAPGEKVIWWPRVDVPGAVYLFCEETASEMERRKP